MAHLPNSALFAVALVAGAAAIPAHGETRVSCDSIPATVMQQAKTEAPDATIHGCVKDKEDGKLTYEVETIKDGKSMDMSFDAAGKLLEVEQQVDRATLPPAVSDAISKAARGGNVGKVESVSRNGAIASYETIIERKGRKKEVAFSPEGAPMKAD